MGDPEEADIPDRETCQKLTEQFAQLTNTDELCAHFYLQDTNWNLETALNTYFEAQGETPVGNTNITNNTSNTTSNATSATRNIAIAGNSSEVEKKDGKIDQALVKAFGMTQPTCAPPSRFKFVTWNLDGLDEHNLKRRTKAVCKILFQQKFDIVFLQEVVPETFQYISEKLPEYMCIPGNDEGYFTATLLWRYTVYHDCHEIIPFPNSLMMRNLLYVQAHIGPVKLQLYNTHLESGADHSDERKNQLRELFKEVQKVSENFTVIFGGDLNMRDKELSEIGGVPPGVDDLWVTCGSRKECQYTWDTHRNTNRQWPGKFKPRLRFDRAYLRSSHPRTIVPKFFGLIGIQKVSQTQSYPSDHWGIEVHFDVDK